MKTSCIKNGILRIVQGIIIGAGAILPGVSGGVLAVIFGIYRPAMELLTHPKRALARYWRMLLAVGQRHSGAVPPVGDGRNVPLYRPHPRHAPRPLA